MHMHRIFSLCLLVAAAETGAENNDVVSALAEEEQCNLSFRQLRAARTLDSKMGQEQADNVLAATDVAADDAASYSEKTSYNEKEALKFAHLAAAAYCGAPTYHTEDLESLDCGPACSHLAGRLTGLRLIHAPGDNDASYSIAGRLDGECVLGFRGTSSFSSAIADVKSAFPVALPHCEFKGQQCMVGAGFLDAFNRNKKHILKALDELGCGKSAGVAVTGHSLGAAEAIVAMYELKLLGYNIRTSYTFGQPRAGNDAFVHAFRQALGDTSIFRLVHAGDPIVKLGPGGALRHVGTEVFYRGETHEGYKVCPRDEDSLQCSAGAADIRWMFSGADDHRDYLRELMGYRLSGGCRQNLQRALGAAPGTVCPDGSPKACTNPPGVNGGTSCPLMQFCNAPLGGAKGCCVGFR
eukprot:TRINITY_DN59481_c0_g1_i1.p1 TRINITY_DN59481_c0_g1~~TRINITY_DN59481_c0_g1_i1.p1  ORF type:complete len:426 (+),score=80.04 TRINITY_DN59481_c0_g1_i1:50-1279(+)